jgi:hypothetical protein
MMDVRSRNVKDPDKRIGSRIAELKKDEIGYQKVKRLIQDGKEVKMKENGTILEVELASALAPNSSTQFDLQFEALVHIQIMRSGRDNA